VVRAAAAASAERNGRARVGIARQIAAGRLAKAIFTVAAPVEDDVMRYVCRLTSTRSQEIDYVTAVYEQS
jgi:hypothetical protein